MLARSLPVVLLFAVCVVGAARADDVSKQESIQDAVQRLGSDRYSDRQTASQELQGFGKEAIPALAKAAASDDSEVRGRAVEILTRHFKSGDVDTKAAAEGALKEIAEGDQPAVVNLAKQALQPETQQNPGFPAINGGIVIPAQIQIQVQANAIRGPGQRFQMRQVNGVRDIEAQDGERKVKIHEDPNQGIKIEVTEKKDGKEVTEKYEAKNADELKKNHPEAHKIYEQYNRNGGGIQIRANAVPVQPRAVPARRNNEAMQKGLERHIELLKKQAENNPNPAAIKQAIEQLEKLKQQFGGEAKAEAEAKNVEPDENAPAERPPAPADPIASNPFAP